MTSDPSMEPDAGVEGVNLSQDRRPETRLDPDDPESQTEQLGDQQGPDDDTAERRTST